MLSICKTLKIKKMATITMNGIWDFLQSLSLSTRNKKWLADRLIHDVERERAAARQQDPTLMTKEEFFAKVDRAKAQYERGEYKTIHSHEELEAFLNSL